MGVSVLTNRDIFPSDEVLGPILGKSILLWKSFFEMLESDYSDLKKEWRFYNDGKTWLMKITKNKKTIIWLSVVDRSFRTTFYLPPKVSNLIESLRIPEELKDQYRKSNKMTKGITIFYSKRKDIEYARDLIKVKSSIK